MRYSDIDKPELIKGIKFWKNEGNRFNVLMLHYSADEDKDPDRNGLEWYENEKSGMPKSSWEKEYEIDFSTKSGQLVYSADSCDFDENIHLVDSFGLPEPYQLVFSLDFGQRNPTAGIMAAWDGNTLWIIDEWGEPALPSKSSRDMFYHFAKYICPHIDEADLPGISLERRKELINAAINIKVADPSIRNKTRSKFVNGEEIPYSILEEFEDNGWEFDLANNEWTAGVTRVKEYFRIRKNGKPRLYIFKDKCPKLVKELLNYRYKELTPEQLRSKNKSEEAVKKNDHFMDALRYLIMTRPLPMDEPTREKTMIERDIESLLKPRIINDWDVE